MDVCYPQNRIYQQRKKNQKKKIVIVVRSKKTEVANLKVGVEAIGLSQAHQ
jgi:hypothetical protein